jgi:hypothetical protein
MLWQVCGQNITWLNSSQSPTQVRKLPLCLQGSCQAGYHLPSEREFWWSFLDVWSLNLSGVIEPLCFFPLHGSISTQQNIAHIVACLRFALAEVKICRRVICHSAPSARCGWDNHHFSDFDHGWSSSQVKLVVWFSKYEIDISPKRSLFFDLSTHHLSESIRWVLLDSLGLGNDSKSPNLTWPNLR